MSKYELLCMLHKISKDYTVRFNYLGCIFYLMDFSKWSKKVLISDYSADHILSVDIDEFIFTDLTILPR